MQIQTKILGMARLSLFLESLPIILFFLVSDK